VHEQHWAARVTKRLAGDGAGEKVVETALPAAADHQDARIATGGKEDLRSPANHGSTAVCWSARTAAEAASWLG
jgi:hypothetical protein